MYRATNLNIFGGKIYSFLGNIPLYTYNQHIL